MVLSPQVLRVRTPREVAIVTNRAVDLQLLAAELELGVSPEGEPVAPLVFLPLDRWRDAPPEVIGRAARIVAGALPLTAGLLSGPPAPGPEPLLAAAPL